MEKVSPIVEKYPEQMRLQHGREARAQQVRDELRAEQRANRQKAMAELIPPRFQHRTLLDYKPKSPSQGAAARAVDMFIADTIAGLPRMLALIGKQGTGKSHLLYAAAKALHGQDFWAQPYAWYRLADELRWGRGDLSAQRVREKLFDHEVVLLDEVRTTAGTALDENELAKFSCHAYDNNVSVLLTTNHAPLADIMGEAAASRYTKVEIDGPDGRGELSA